MNLSQRLSHLILVILNRAESKKVFVGGLPTEVTEKDFADYFGTFGLVKVISEVSECLNRIVSDSLIAHSFHRT